MKVSDKAILITGASQGLGRALALELARRGAKVALTARSAEALFLVEREIRARGGIAHALPADIADKRAIYPLVAQAAALIGPIQVLINNASTLGQVPLRFLLDTDCEILDKSLETNLVGPFRLTKALLGPMLLAQSGVILNISTDASINAYARWGAYSVAKAALDHLSRIWAEELSGTQVRILSVDPGEMDTRMHADAMPNSDRALLANPTDVALGIADIVETAESFKNGSRIIASERRKSCDPPVVLGIKR